MRRAAKAAPARTTATRGISSLWTANAAGRATAPRVEGSGAPANRTRLALLLAAAAAFALLAAIPAASALAACPNDAFRTGPGANLPECRAYEQVSPVDKHGADIQHSYRTVKAAPDGSALTFGDANGLPTTGGSSNPVVYMAHRGAEGWPFDGLRPLSGLGFDGRISGWSEDFSTSLGATTDGDLLLLDTVNHTWKKIGSAPTKGTPTSETYLSDYANDDPEHFIFESVVVYAPGGVFNRLNLYEYNHGTITTTGRVPAFPATECDDSGGPACEDPPAGTYGGPYNWLSPSLTDFGGAKYRYYTENTISADGSKVFFTELGTGRLFMREDGTRTVQVSASQRTVPDPNGHRPAAWVASSVDGSKVFFMSCEKLTNDSTAVSIPSSEVCDSHNAEVGMDLYEYDTDTGDLTDLTVDSNPGDLGGAAVRGLLGISADGSDVYFAANGNLAAGAAHGDCADKTGAGTAECSIYLSHDGIVSLVSRVPELNFSARENWMPQFSNPDAKHTSRVSANGVLVFASRGNLTAYDSQASTEIYRYSPGDAGVTCLSCDPSGAPPVATSEGASLGHYGSPANAVPQWTFLQRNVSADGSRVFFETADPLAAADVNGEGGCPLVGNLDVTSSCQDVYMWEAEGAGDCEGNSENGGCLYLLSSGTSPDPSFFGDNSRSGDDAFIFTTSQLVPQDKDALVDAYDVRVDGGIAAQHPAPPLPPCEGEACRDAASPVPGLTGAGSAVFEGPGDPAPTFKQCKQGKVLTKGRCKPKPRKHRKQKRRHAASGKGGSK